MSDLVAEFSIPGEPVSKARARFTKRGGAYTPEKTRAGEERATAAKARRTTRFRGSCEACGAGVTRKEYRRCAACVRSGQRATGKPKATTATEEIA